MTYISARERAFELLELGRGRDPASRALDFSLSALIVANVAAVMLETVNAIYIRYGYAFRIFEVISVAIFTVEYVVRIWSSTADRFVAEHGPIWGRIRFMAKPYQIIDLIAILPFYIMLIAPFDLRALRIFRLLRFLKLLRYSRALTTLGNVLISEGRSLMASLVVMAGLLIASSTVMYHVERYAQPEEFASIPAAMWWSLATLTTVGYGDVTPVTVLGKVIGAAVMIFGLGMAALPIGILANGFAEEIKRRDFVITWGMVARAPLFAKLDAAEVATVMRLLKSRSVRAGEVIMAPGDRAQAMFFIDQGQVEIRASREEIRHMGDGDFFGEKDLLAGGRRQILAKATADTRLLVLDRDDLLHMFSLHPNIGEHLRKAATDLRSELDFSPAGPTAADD